MEFEKENFSGALKAAEKRVVSLEKFKLEENMQRSQRKCEELEETVTRTLEDNKISQLREKRAEERCEKISPENTKMSYEFHNSICELYETIKQLKNKNLENEEKYEGVMKKMGQEIEDLGHENLKSVKTIEELGREYLENKKTTEELRLKNSESDTLASVYKSRFENLSPRIKKIEDILMERENGLKIEIENLTIDRDSAKDKVRMLERKGDSVDLERLNFEENLRKSQRKCNDLEEKVARLLEDMEVSKDREKRADERNDKIFAEHMKMTIVKNRSIYELQDTINELKTKNMENDQLLLEYKDKCNCLGIKVAQMDQEIKGLTLEKLDAVKAIDELRAEISESNIIINELKLKILESEKVAKGKNDSLGNAAEVVAVNPMSPGVSKSPIAIGSKNNGLSKKGDRNSVQQDDADACTVNTPRVSQPFRDPQAKSNKCKDPLDSGARSSGTQLMSVVRCSTKSTHSPPPAAGDIIVIIESDDETSANQNGHIPNRVLGSNPSKNKMNPVQSPLSEQRRKRNRTDTGEGFFGNSTTKNKRNTCSNGVDTVSIQKKENQTPKSMTTRDRIDRFTSSLPSFNHVIKKTNIGNYSSMLIPKEFQKKYLPLSRQEIILQDSEGISWLVSVSVTNGKLLWITGGWKAFADSHSIKKDDICTFELVEQNSFKVRIFSS